MHVRKPAALVCAIVAVFACAVFAAGYLQDAYPDEEEAAWESFDKPIEDSNQSSAIQASSVQSVAETNSFGATGAEPWNEYDKQVKGSGEIAPLGPDLFGDQVEFYKNTLSFSVTDISLPGNFSLPVSLTRRLSVTDRYTYDGHDEPVGDWDLDIPRISGNYAPVWADTRCSSPKPAPPAVGEFQVSDFWHGLDANMPGGGELIKADKGVAKPPEDVNTTYPLMTSAFTYVRCLTDTNAPGGDAVLNSTGEGFEAITSDGTKYTFAWMAMNEEPDLLHGAKWSEGGSYTLHRTLNSLYVTQVRDRFGNTVNYTYDNLASQPVRLRTIQASDGRLITLNYTNGVLSSAVAHGKTWTYQYQLGSLSAVILPDASRWTYDFAGLSNAAIEPDLDPNTPRSCNGNAAWVGLIGGTGTVTHPSGAVGEFTVGPARHGRSNVPKFCENWETPYNNPNNDVSVIPRSYDVLSIKSKKITGPGLAPQEWTISGGSLKSWAPGTDPNAIPKCNSLTCMDPVCVDDSCAGTHTTVISGPNGEWQRITFGNSYKYNEGKLIKIERGTGSDNILETENYAYDLAFENVPPLPYEGVGFKRQVGTSLQGRAAGYASEYPRPQVSKITTRDGVAFVSAVNLLDSFHRETNADRFSSVLATGADLARKTETTSYRDNLTTWLLGQVAEKHTIANGVDTEVSRTVFFANDLPKEIYSFGLKTKSMTYTPDGLLNTVADGKGNTTTFSSWKRGTPQWMQLANALTVSASVNDSGLITSITDELGTTTNYDYDAMGRLALVDYTNTDSVLWNSTNQTFAPMSVAEYGVPAGSWKQTIWTGNSRTTTYFDARFQPVLTRTEDASNSSTRSFVVKRFDARGRVVFQSYPVGAITDYKLALPGVSTEFDAIGRVTAVKQDSELGVLTTTTSYSAPFKVTVTNPRGFSTTTDYQAFDTPATEAPVKVTAPETQTTTILRDEFGKPKSITRAGFFGGAAVSATRTYIYDANQRLCIQVDPETGSTVTDYDAAGNLAWSATGQAANSCDDRAALSTSIPTTSRVVRTYDVLNRIKLMDVPNSSNDPTYDYYGDGKLKSVVNGAARWDYTYNLRRLPLTEVLTYAGKVRTLSHAYNANGHEQSLTYPSGLVVNTAPDAMGRPTQAGSFATDVAYFPNGGMSGFLYGNGISHSLIQNARLLPSVSLDQKSGLAAVLKETYVYDPNGNTLSIVDGTGTGQGTRDQLTYDGLDRLTYAHTSNPDWTSATTTYDALGNIRYNKVGTREWTYNYDAPRNRLISMTRSGASVTLGYDPNGNVTTKDGASSYSFDSANRLQVAVGKESYVYDGQGRRVEIKRLSDGRISYPMYSNAGQLITEDDSRSNQTTDYVYLNGSLVGKRFTTIGGTTWTTRYIHTDSLGSPLVETSSTAAIVGAKTYYTPYGEPTSYKQGPGFTGHVTDALTGLSYMQQRYYDPQIGRFLSVDPAASGFNQYAYASNNPYRSVDPDGRQTCDTVLNGGCGSSIVHSFGAGESTPTTERPITENAQSNPSGKVGPPDSLVTNAEVAARTRNLGDVIGAVGGKLSALRDAVDQRIRALFDLKRVEYHADFGYHYVGNQIQFGATIYTQDSHVFSAGDGPPKGYFTLFSRGLPVAMHNHCFPGRADPIDIRYSPYIGTMAFKHYDANPTKPSPQDMKSAGWLSIPGNKPPIEFNMEPFK